MDKVIIDGVDVSGCMFATNTIPVDCDNNTCFCYEDKDCYYKQLKRLQAENERLYEEKNCLHKIIDRLLENAGYSKDIASAEDFEDVYENMQYNRQKLSEYKQTLQEIRDIADENKDTAQYRGICLSILDKINEVIGGVDVRYVNK